nr:carbohydrate-binding module family CBM9 [uncultured bacterium]
MLKYALTITIFFVSLTTYAQSKEVGVKFIDTPITIDGSLDEPVWNETQVATNFWQYFPTDSIQAPYQSEIRFLYTDKTLYVGIKVFSQGDDYVIPSLKRDFRAGGSDNITLMFDTFNDGNNAFLFGSNPLGIRREALVSGGGTDLRGFTTSWDTKWMGETKQYDGYYVCEWAIPMSAFKFREGETKWRFNSYQFDTQDNTRNTWINIPQNQFIFNLAYMGDMVFEKPLGNSKSPISIIPYINAIAGQDREIPEDFTEIKVGGDARFTIGNSLNLDVTINPDFSQVEVDNAITNLSRFEVGLPERRQFFIENSDLFADFGDPRAANPFFSRRIGIAEDVEGNTIINNIVAGARLSGKLNNNLRVGLLNMQTQKDEINEISANNNTVIALQHRVFSRSNISAIFVNRQATGNKTFVEPGEQYNRLVGLDYNLANEDNSWNGKFYLHKSFSPGVERKDFSGGARIEYNRNNWRATSATLFVNEDFNSDLGFIPRKDIFRNFSKLERLIFPKSGAINRHIFSLNSFYVWRPELDFTLGDRTLSPQWEAEFKNTASLAVKPRARFTKLFDTFDPSRSEGLELPEGSEFSYNSIELEYNSDRRKALSYTSNATYGDYFNGEILTLRAGATLRLQPKLIIGFNARYDKINLPAPYSDNDIWLVSPRVEVTFTKNLFWNTLLQYSTLQDNFGINSRLQWRFAPLSDLFLVYNDNYFTNTTFAPRFRSINLKLTYWLYL